MDKRLKASPTQMSNIVVKLEGKGRITGDGPIRWLCGNCGQQLADGQGGSALAIAGSACILCTRCRHYNEVPSVDEQRRDQAISRQAQEVFRDTQDPT